MPQYDIYIEENGLLKLPKYIKEVYEYDDVYIVTDQTVYDLYQERVHDILSDFKVFFVVVKPGEKSKSLETYHQVVKELVEKGIKRNQKKWMQYLLQPH